MLLVFSGVPSAVRLSTATLTLRRSFGLLGHLLCDHLYNLRNTRNQSLVSGKLTSEEFIGIGLLTGLSEFMMNQQSRWSLQVLKHLREQNNGTKLSQELLMSILRSVLSFLQQI